MGIFKQQSDKKTKHWNIYQQPGIPNYLAKYYWWAYLSPVGVVIFDHPSVVNRILWGQYHKIVKATAQVLASRPIEQLIEISCAYGEIIPLIASSSGANNISLLDIAPIQLKGALKKLNKVGAKHVNVIRANAEKLPMSDNQFDTSLLFFLLHELPPASRQQTLLETLRVSASAGRILIADYNQKTTSHWFHTLPLFRNIFEKLEPFLGDFWRCDLFAELELAAKANSKQVKLIRQQTFWHDFYRLLEIEII